MNTRINRRGLLLTGSALVAMALAGVARAEDKIKIGFSQGTMNHPWRVAQVEVNKKYAKDHYPDVDLIVTDGQNASSKQVSDVESLLAQGIKVLILSPLTADALTPVAKEAMDAGIPVITLDRKVNTPVTLHIGAENKPIGMQAADEIAEALGGKGSVIEIQGTAGASATIDRHDGFAEELKKYPNIKVIASQYADYLREPAMKFMEDTLQRFGPGQIQAVYAHNDEMALGAVQALEAAGRLEEVKVVGIDGQNTAFEAVKAGKLMATFVYPFVAPEGIEYAYKVAKGEKLPPTIVLKSAKVDSSNVDQFLGKGF
jgi:ribose transport system substrate-binding protein